MTTEAHVDMIEEFTAEELAEQANQLVDDMYKLKQRCHLMYIKHGTDRDVPKMSKYLAMEKVYDGMIKAHEDVAKRLGNLIADAAEQGD